MATLEVISMKWRILAGVVVGLLAFWFSGQMWVAPQPAAEGPEFMQEIVAELTTMINGWRSEAQLIIGLTVAVAIFGAIAAIPQSSTGKWYKRVALYAGTSVTALTVISTTVFDIDHRMLNRMVNEACCKVSDIRFYSMSYADADSADKTIIFEEVRQLVREVYDIEARRYEQLAALPGLVPPAYAGDPAYANDLPAWVTTPPEDRRNVYFVGVGDGISLSDAKDGSYANAIEQATEYLAIQFERTGKSPDVSVDVKALTGYLTGSTEIARTHCTMDRSRKIWRHYTLLRLGKHVAEADLKMFEIQHRVMVPKAFSQAIQTAERTQDDYTSRRQLTYENILDSTAESYPPEVIAQLNEARRLRKAGRNDQAVTTLSGLVQRFPDLYLALFNLGLAYDDLGDSASACSYYEKACAVEREMPIRDASLYNTYGDFLYRHGDYDGAVRVLNVALEIYPDHPTAAKTLEAAEAKVGP
jgi:tetratricopeptide (TPR) repeat protein